MKSRGRPPGTPNMTPALFNAIVEQLKSHKSGPTIAEELGISAATVYRVRTKWLALQQQESERVIELQNEIARLNTYIGYLTGRLAQLEQHT